jgi:hypothetical protein
VLLGSCGNVAATSSVPIGYAMRNEGADLFVHLGDYDYDDPGNNSSLLDIRARNTRRFRSVAAFRDMLKTTPAVAMYDNHDSSSAAGHWDTAYLLGNHQTVMAATREMYDDTVPNYPYAETSNRQTSTQAFTLGRTRWALLDTHSRKRYFSGTPTILGSGSDGSWDQLSWLKSDMAAAQASGAKYYFICTPTSWAEQQYLFWSYGLFVSERDSLTSWISANLNTMQPFIVVGDQHYSALSDGTGMPGGLPIIMSSPLFNWGGSSMLDGRAPPYTWNGVRHEVDNLPQGTPGAVKMSRYMVVQVSDDGVSDPSMVITCKSSPVDPDTFLPTTDFSVSWPI